MDQDRRRNLSPGAVILRVWPEPGQRPRVAVDGQAAPAFGWGVPLIITLFQLTYVGVLTPTWMHFTRWLVS